MYEAASFDPSSAKSSTFNTNLPINGKFIAWNESNIGLTLTFANGDTGYAPAGVAKVFALPTPNPNVTWTQKNMLTGQAFLSQVTIEAYQPNEEIIGTYPLNIEHQTLIANTVTTVGGGSTNIQNDNNASGTQFIESTVSGSPGSNIIMQNQGLIEVLQWISNSLTQIFKLDPGAASVVKLGNTGLTSESLGNMTVDQVLSVIGNTSLSTLATSGLATLNSLSVTNNATVGGPLGVTGNTSMSTASTSGKATLNSAEISTTLRVDTTSEFVGAATFDSNPILSNAVALQAKDSGGTARTVLQVDGSNNTQIFGVTGTDKAQFLKSDGTLQALIDLVKGCLNLSTPSTVINGGTAGTATHWMPLQGSSLKLVLIKENGFQTAAGNQDYSFPTAFTNGGIFITTDAVTWSFLKSGSVQNANVVTAFGTASFQSTVTNYTFGQMSPNTAIDGIRHNGGAGSAHTGWVLVIGN